MAEIILAGEKQTEKPSVDVELNVLSVKLENIDNELSALTGELNNVLQPEFTATTLSSGTLSTTGVIRLNETPVVSQDSVLVSKVKSLSKQAQEMHDRLHRLTERLQV
jgi:chaperonin cofactor prefoldin